MSGSDGIEDLKKSMSDALKKKGILGKIQAELRASVFLTLEESGYNVSADSKTQPPRTHPKLIDFANTDSGLLVIDLVRDFLRTFDLGFTDNVLVPEASIDPQRAVPNQMDLAFSAKLPADTLADDAHTPLLAVLLRSHLARTPPCSQSTPFKRTTQATPPSNPVSANPSIIASTPRTSPIATAAPAHSIHSKTPNTSGLFQVCKVFLGSLFKQTQELRQIGKRKLFR